MFESLKIYTGEKIDLKFLFSHLDAFGYERVARISSVGDYDHRGEIISIFPLTFQDPIRLELTGEDIKRIQSFDLASGKPIEEHKIVIVLPIKGVYKKKIRTRRQTFAERSPIEGFVDIEYGDRVVHVDHGIGIYRGIERHKAGPKILDHIVIEYIDGDRLYMPFSELNLVQKYIGFEKRPKLNKLGGRGWKRTKMIAQKGITNYAMELLELSARRESAKGHAYSPDNDWQINLERRFPFEETPDQRRSTEEVKKDMERDRPMDRLICGDVGYGKTEVAIRAAFKAVMDDKQVAILVPTTILAEQHFATFTARMHDYPLEIAMLSRFRSKGEQRDILRRLRQGLVDIIIGTHRLLSGDVSFKELGLLIIDEEQRFGVTHKENLKRMRLSLDVLTMTATPIPRTLYMSLMGAKDMSQLNTPPQNRLPIETRVSVWNERTLKEAVDTELSRKGQVYFVTDRIEGIEDYARTVKKLSPDSKVAIAHGAMHAKDLEKAMIKFMKGQIDVLVSTSIVESGIDIPNANTIIINNANNFGLADLYQLRGRVGRFKRQAFAYLFVPKGSAHGEKVSGRLDAIAKFTELGSGFKVAMRDLEMRGAGNILGTEQHGYINSIGFDLYCRLLKGAIGAVRKGLSIH